jgi:hypothetical protein
VGEIDYRKAREQLVELQRQLGSQEKEKSSLAAAQSKLKISQKKVESLTWEVEVLHQKFERAIRKYSMYFLRSGKIVPPPVHCYLLKNCGL